jgi:hypothetical protein
MVMPAVITAGSGKAVRADAEIWIFAKGLVHKRLEVWWSLCP